MNKKLPIFGILFLLSFSLLIPQASAFFWSGLFGGDNNQDSLVNDIPIANAGEDQIVNEGTLVILNGTASNDPDGEDLTYIWTAPEEITLSDNTTSIPTFTAPNVTEDTNYTFSLVVNDGTSNSTADEVIITVLEIEDPTGITLDKTEISSSLELEQTADETFTITNNENTALTLNLAFEKYDNVLDSYNDLIVSLSTETLTIAPDATETITVSIDASQQETVINDIGGKIKITGDNITEEVSLNVDTYTDLFDNGDGLFIDNKNPSDLEVNPGDDFSFDIDVKDPKYDLENVRIIAKVLDMEDSDGDDLEFEADEFDLDRNKDESIDINFVAPLNIDKEDYYVVVTLEGEYLNTSDDDWYEFDLRWVFTNSDDKINLVKERDEVNFEYATISPNTVANAGDIVTISFNVVNTGRTTYKDGSLVKLFIDDLGITQSLILEDDLEKDSDNDREYSGHFLVEIPADAEAGDYTVRLKFYDDDEEYISNQKSATLIIQSSGTADTTADTTTDTNTETSDNTVFLPTGWSTLGLDDETWNQVFWILGDVLLLIIAIYFLTLIFRRKR
tara:strand:- start:13 stop:1701 length:1689 start_codon:yes stop_codon:yes gene_type:complete